MAAIELVASKIAGAVLSAGVRSVLGATVPGPGAGLVSNPRRPRLRLTKPKKIEAEDVNWLAKSLEGPLTELAQREFVSLSDNERERAQEAACEAFVSTKVDIWEVDLDPESYRQQVQQSAEPVLRQADLSHVGTDYYELIIRQLSLHIVQFVTTWPTFAARIELEQLKRIRGVAEAVAHVYTLLETGTAVADLDFEARYLGLVADRLDSLEIFGVDLADPSKRTYDLTTAYITLSLAAAEADQPVQRSRSAAAVSGLRAETAICNFKRVLIRGDAGSGKTTLMQWLSVSAARHHLDEELSEWNTLVPFVLPLRRFANGTLPQANEFFPEVGTILAGEMPRGWVNRILDAGRGLVLIDGVDEIPAKQRVEVREWLQDLVDTYDKSFYLITSRPAAAESDWLSELGFSALDMLPMSKADVEAFIRHWHQAASRAEPDQTESEALHMLERDLLGRIRAERQLARLASNPLMCALLCTLNRDRNARLPQNRMEVYSAALNMLLLRRDRERRLDYPEIPHLGDSQKKSILGDFAYWLMRNGASDSSEDEAVEQVKISLKSMPRVRAAPREVHEYLLTRSGCLRRPAAHRVDFVHRTFQEYLAAGRIVERNDLGLLVANAHLDQWHQVVVMAAGHARPEERSKLLGDLLDRGDANPSTRSTLHLLAAACLDTAGELDPDVYERVRAATKELLPPRRMSDAKALAAAGEMVIPLLPRSKMTAAEAAATIRTATTVGGDAALQLIAAFARDSRLTVQRELARSWDSFDAEEYGRTVVAANPTAWREISVGSEDLLPALRYATELRKLSVLCLISNSGWLSQNPGLVDLDISYANGAFTFAALQGCPGLRQVAIRYELDKADVGSLAGMRLNQLRLECQSYSGDWPGFPRMPDLQTLKILGYTNADLISAPFNLPNLRDLEVTVSGSIENIAEIARMPQLTRLGLQVVPPFQWLGLVARHDAKGSGIRDIGALANSPNLRRIDIIDPLAERFDLRPFLSRQELEMSIHLPATAEIIGADDKRVSRRRSVSLWASIDECRIVINSGLSCN
ncbi:NACHT domain-containing protein [Kitasatospora sp. NPDC090091]|uniref:NACHT domain-containing protein n=1 Tax=Kitasatospora sp. NPDC090091 TaxID=3364081 RepID=UPI0038135823